MSKLSLYESNWINLVFENRNKEYGAFQLRMETLKTSLRALTLGILLCTTLIVLPNILHLIKGEIVPIPITTDWDKPIVIDRIYSPERQKQNTTAPAPKPAETQKPVDAIDSKQLINPTVVSAVDATPVEKFTLDKTNPTDKTNDGMVTTGANTDATGGVEGGTGTGNEIGTGTSEGTGTEILTDAVLDKKPQFPGGIEKFYRYIGTHFNSPVMEESKTVRIFVSFVVEKDGSMTSIKVLNKPGVALEKEAIRVLNSIKTKWSPGIYNSKPVRTAYNLPILVQVE